VSRSIRAALVAATTTLCAAAAAAPAQGQTVWVCKPGQRDDVCATSLSTTRISPSGARQGVQRVRRDRNRRADCFYVYPTVSDQQGVQATKAIDPEIRSIALYQAARYSQHCRVFAPVYRQITILGLGRISEVTAEMRETAYRDVRDAWREYLRRHNRGRPVVVIGHSQGTFVLRRLLAEEVDRKPAVRRRLVSALLLGGGVLVAEGSDRGGDFRRIPACRSQRQVGCVVAFNTFNAAVPEGSRFGRTQEAGREVLCTNPAALGGGSGAVTPIWPSEPFAPGTVIGTLTTGLGFASPEVATEWIAAPASYRARCSSAGGADALQITSLRGAPVLRPQPDPTWGLHLADANIALGNLVSLVRRQIAAYRRG
jgi:hypothetical protein